ncbi:glycosyltransferase [Microbacterium fluvii]|uniref:4,4'-diaponeurosporenoate glycosyltransferase n=1 Tax=Microbacterium fluvii TaxID=415215 RepID=A0ABW2H7L7_9MICO|nr:glycosyltransferase [Microbacterium fluvii]MCU4670996.1 glycosyltransferase [Microbacterium fluvii]
MSARIDAVAVVVPAHDEEQLLPACLRALESAVRNARRLMPKVIVCVVLDACRDASPQIARTHGVEVVTVDARCVGAARAAGVERALSMLAPLPTAHIWTAHTDADSVVPPHWLTHQIELARGGAGAMIGTVRPDFDDLTEAQRTAWLATHVPGEANGHVHGANLGVRADVLLGAGGFAATPLHEDVLLVEAIRSGGARMVASDAAWVLTSGRPFGRAPGGYARYLREDLVAAAGDISAGYEREEVR